MTPWSERGTDRSTVCPTDPPVAHYVAGLFAGYDHARVSNADLDEMRRPWLRGFFAGAALRRRVREGRQ